MKGSRISAWRVLGRVFYGLLVVIHRTIYSDRGQLITLYLVKRNYLLGTHTTMAVSYSIVTKTCLF